MWKREQCNIQCLNFDPETISFLARSMPITVQSIESEINLIQSESLLHSAGCSC